MKITPNLILPSLLTAALSLAEGPKLAPDLANATPGAEASSVAIYGEN